MLFVDIDDSIACELLRDALELALIEKDDKDRENL